MKKMFVQKLIMEIKCNTNPYLSKYHPNRGGAFYGRRVNLKKVLCSSVQECAKTDIVEKSPVVEKCATGLLNCIQKLKSYCASYVQNIKHTYEHKIIFALVEKEVFGKNSIDSITHDLDKLILYLIGFPKSFVSKFHRLHSEHHTESGKQMNLRSMICDNIASSPEFKPEKKKSLREHYCSCKALQNVEGLGELLEKFHYGEDLDLQKINLEKNTKYHGTKGIFKTILLFA